MQHLDTRIYYVWSLDKELVQAGVLVRRGLSSGPSGALDGLHSAGSGTPFIIDIHHSITGNVW